MTVQIINADVMAGLSQLADESVNCVVTSPPYYGLRDYGVDGQIGLESTPNDYVCRLVDVFRDVRRILRDDGVLWLNLGDSYCSTAPGTAGDPIHRRGIFAGVTEETSEARRKQRPKTPDGMKPKDLMGIPWAVAFALRADGWYLRRDIIWHKEACMPESVRDRCTTSHEYVFMLTKSARYFYDCEAIAEPAAYPSGPNAPDKIKSPYGQGYTRENRKSDAIGSNGRNVQSTNSEAERRDVPGCSFNNNPRLRGSDTRNKRSVWTINPQPFKGAHFATMPPELAETCIKAGCPVGGTVLDPFSGAGTTALVADRLQRNAIGIELNPEYAAMSERRINGDRGALLDLMEV